MTEGKALTQRGSGVHRRAGLRRRTPSPSPPSPDAPQGPGSEAMYYLAAHKKATCALSFCPAVAGLFLTASTDKKVGSLALLWVPEIPCTGLGAWLHGARVAVSAWEEASGPVAPAPDDLPSHRQGHRCQSKTLHQVKLWDTRGGGEPALLATQDLKVGAVFSAGFCADAPMLVAAGGAAGTVAVWDTTTCEAVTAFAGVESA